MIVPMIGFSQTANEYFEKAYDYAENGEYQLAIDNYTRAIRIDPDFTKAYIYRGFAYRSSGKCEDASFDFTRAIKIAPDDPYVHEWYDYRGNAYGCLGNYEDAIADFTKAVRINPDFSGAYSNRGNTYSSLGNYEDAIADYTRAIRIDPYAHYYKNRGITKEDAGLPYCSDYKRACDLGEVDCCEWWYSSDCK